MAGGLVQKNSQRSGGRRFPKRNGHRLMSEINVTPFVDVMLVLLIIFMVAAPLLTVGVEIELPKTAAKALPAEEESPLTLHLTQEKELILQDSKIEFEQFDFFSEDMLKYCRNDVDLTQRLYKFLITRIKDFGYSVELEHEVAKIIQKQHERGFKIDIVNAYALQAKFQEDMNNLQTKVRATFPPLRIEETFIPKSNKVPIVDTVHLNGKSAIIRFGPLSKVSIFS